MSDQQWSSPNNDRFDLLRLDRALCKLIEKSPGSFKYYPCRRCPGMKTSAKINDQRDGSAEAVLIAVQLVLARPDAVNRPYHSIPVLQDGGCTPQRLHTHTNFAAAVNENKVIVGLACLTSVSDK